MFVLIIGANEGFTNAIKVNDMGKTPNKVIVSDGNNDPILGWSGVTNQKRDKKRIDPTIEEMERGSSDILRMMRFYSVLGIVAKEYGMQRAALIFLIGHYLKNRQIQKFGRPHPSLTYYIKDHRLLTSNKLIAGGYLRRVNGSTYETTDLGLRACVRFTNALAHSQQIDKYRRDKLGPNKP